MKNHTDMARMPDRYGCDRSTSGHAARLLFFGDLMVMHGDRVPELSPELCALLGQADMVIGNCEAPVGNHKPDPQVRYKFDYYMPQEYLDAILRQFRRAGQTVALSLANNHSGDRGVSAYLRTPSLMRELGVTPTGEWSEDRPPLSVTEVGGMRVGLVAWTHWMNRDVFQRSPGVCRWFQVETANWAELRRAYRLDYLVGLPHWEWEWQHFPRWQTRDRARLLVESMGFDLLVGSHPHTLFPMEEFARGLCVYSLGNLVGQGVAWPAKLITLFEVVLEAGDGTGVGPAAYRMHYYVQEHGGDGVRIVPLSRADARMKARLRNRIGRIYVTDEHAGGEKVA